MDDNELRARPISLPAGHPDDHILEGDDYQRVADAIRKDAEAGKPFQIVDTYTLLKLLHTIDMAQLAITDLNSWVDSQRRHDNQNLSIEVLTTLPEGLTEVDDALRRYRKAKGTINGEPVNYHYCDECGGWLKGRPVARDIQTLGRLSGRRGTEYRCVRCDHRIGFTGIVS